jgi:hypothetical protein
MNRQPSPAERWSIGILSALGLVTFFLPLVSLHVPIAGDVAFSGYDVVARMREFRQSLELGNNPLREPEAKTPDQSRSATQSPKGSGSLEFSTSSGPELPLSVKLAWLIPLAIIGAYVFALLAFCGSFTSWSMARVASTASALFGVAATIHTLVINSDMHAMYQRITEATKADLKDNPFAGLADAIGKVMANAFQLSPGVGLYVLVISLGIAAILVHSRLLSRIRLAPASV